MGLVKPAADPDFSFAARFAGGAAPRAPDADGQPAVEAEDTPNPPGVDDEDC